MKELDLGETGAEGGSRREVIRYGRKQFYAI
jgi:CO dehydrogenase/acetyl-CoA synthase delta subunit